MPSRHTLSRDIFELSDGRGVHAFLDADLQGSADRPDEELAELHLYDAADDSRRHRYVLRRNGAMEHFFDIVAKDRFSETGELENDLLAEGDRMRVAEKADQEAGIATMTESEALEVIEILRALIAERKREG